MFLRRQGDLRPSLNNVSLEEFAHTEQREQALVQVVVLNAVPSNSTLNQPVMLADEHIIYDKDYIFFENISKLNV